MDSKSRANQIILDVVKELNVHLPNERRLEESASGVLFGRNSKLTSLELVQLIVAVEEKIEVEFGTTITIADERAMSEESSPFATVGTLGEYVSQLLVERSNA